MKVRCDYCDSMIDETEESCPNCGAVLSGANRFAKGQPQTIEELKQWYIDHHLPSEQVTRFFIGKDIKEPRAFGIFKAGSGDYIVYKNKSDGERVLRYCGSDEAYAVNELYQRLKVEIAEQKAKQEKRAIEIEKRRKKEKWQRRNAGCLFICMGITGVLFAVLIVVAVIARINSPAEGYYTYNGSNYYYQGSSWYAYDVEEDDWDEVEDSSALSEITRDNQENYSMDSDSHDGENFEDSEWYRSYSSSSGSSNDDYDSDDWDNDSDWDSSDSWDSGSTDWDSDW